MTDVGKQLVDSYVAWLTKGMTHSRIDDDWVEITTPYLDRHNDCLQVYAKKINGGFLLTDDGHTIEDLEQSGCAPNSRKHEKLLRVTLKGFGIELKNKALEATMSCVDDFPLKHNLVQAMLAVNDMFVLGVPATANRFQPQVAKWLDKNSVRYTPDVKLTGKTGYDHAFDFVVPRTNAQPERIIRAIDEPNRDAVQNTAFAWMDTKEMRAADSKAYAVLNDSELTVPQEVTDALRSYGVEAVPWRARENVRKELVD